MSNKLESEKSPYLIQHADNPVDWYPWGEEAFEKAREENKPVFLSIGYATCHWCHVMAHESFEDPEIAEMMNESFVNIKVDREERPDIDSTYMTVCQMLTGQGGWPLNIIMTPDKEPFYAGTYIPKDARFNRIGLRQLIPGVSGMWNNKPEQVEKAVEKIREGFENTQKYEQGPFPGTEAVDNAAERLASRFDEQYGGFGQSPKFPSAHNLMFLLRKWKTSGDNRFLNMVTKTLESMRLGGMWDHIGYGFHRYSTDEKWLLPHFEKMLYDQALLMMAFTEAWLATRNPLFKQTVHEIAEYVMRDLQHPEGAFYSAEDADSEGEEGKFYVWEVEEIKSLLDEEDSEQFLELFNFEEQGNFKEESSGELTGTNIPHLSEKLGDGQGGWFGNIRETIFKKREQRERPLLDDKILTDWNALMIAALSKAGFVFEEEEFIRAAEAAFTFIEKNLVNREQLFHRFRDEEAAIGAMADDYAFLVRALIELYQATFNPVYLEKALTWNEIFINRFWDEKGGFYFSVQDKDQVFGRQKQIFDGAIPSANSVSMLNQLLLSRLTGKTELETYTEKTGALFSGELTRSGSSITFGMQSIQFIHSSSSEIYFTGNEKDQRKFRRIWNQEFRPFSVLHITGRKNNELRKIAPYTSSYEQADDRPTLYICKNFSCEKPLMEMEQIKKSLVK